MTSMRRAIQLALAISLGGWATPFAWAGLPEGQTAFEREQYPEAMSHFKPLAERGDPQAQAAMAVMYRFGYGVPKDPKTALVWLRKAEAQGHAQSIFRIGEMKEFGEGEPADLAGAVVLYRRAADLGYPRAQTVLGALYADGVEVPQDDALAVQWYEKAAAQGDAVALTNLGRMLQAGRHVPKDEKKAAALFEQAAQKGHARAQAELGVAYLDAIGVKQDVATGVKWLSQAAEGGSDFGQFRLAWAYFEGQGVPADATQAMKWFRTSAEQGFSPAMRETGRRFELGEGAPADLKQARSWYERAAQDGDRLAMYYLGGLHDEGRGVVADKAHAVYWYLRAARLGETHALNDLGAMYFNGEFVAKDLVLAHALFKLAADAGQENGKKNFERTQAELGWSDRRKAEAISKRLGTPEGVDEVLDASLRAAQGRMEPPPDLDATCLPAPPEPAAAQFEAWSRDSHDRGYLWRVRKGERVSYVYGSLHVVRWPWSAPGPRLLEALEAVDAVAVEADVGNPAVMREAAARVPTVELHPAALERLLAALGPACTKVARTPSASAQRLWPLIALRDALALDLHLQVSPDMLLPMVARNRKLAVHSLEDPARVADASGPLFGDGNSAYMQKELSRSPADRRRLLMRIVDIWERGDLEALENTESWCECSLSSEEQVLFRRLNDDRNAGMVQKIDEIHSKGERVLAVIGALHMTGPQSVLKLLAQRGYVVERVQPLRPIGTTPKEIRVLRAGVPSER